MTTVKDTRLEEQTLRAMAALAQPLRLRTFRLLVGAGPDGSTPGVLCEALQATPSGLSFHLKELANAGLVEAEQQGRNIVYRARFDRMTALVEYLTEHCCGGRSCGPAAPRRRGRC
jgi:DNA-binding transcriptional ArsR family regulator